MSFNFPKSPLFLAPMADVTNPAFRMLCNEKGADFTFTEMINAAGFLNGESFSRERGVSFDQKPYGIQIVGPNPDMILKTAVGLEEQLHPAVIDINMGCPSPKILKDKCGAYLLNDSTLPAKIIEAVCSGIKTPVTAKIRIYREDKKTIRLAKSIEDAGAHWLTVHGRTAAQGYSGKANWDVVQKIKEELSIPVILNGDIFTPKDLNAAIGTGCDGFMIGRSAIGNPGIFSKMKEALKNGGDAKPDRFNTTSSRFNAASNCFDANGSNFEFEPDDFTAVSHEEFRQRISDFKRYCFLLDQHHMYPHVNIKSHAQWFTKGLSHSKEMRLEISGLQKETRLRHLNDEEIGVGRQVLAGQIIQVFENYFEKM
ncbi:tRNA-dihydrouridine synthase family protein [Methanolapillus ohkumae]|uniref:tRNA-dihydrouridine synthase B n=1 Tax=Methanolapillus ohkumae TaxID=3028298 RepID=A0AA96ZWU3_9EURY|nr:tRNA-dihydrouridine synthase B [Methanosarcinaceae archaeon Am2]